MIRDTMFDRIRLNPARQLAILAAAFGMAFGRSCRRIVPLSRSHGCWKPHRGVSEMARRRRQIERGQLTASNGLCIHKGRRIVSVPFDMLNRGDRFRFSRAA